MAANDKVVPAQAAPKPENLNKWLWWGAVAVAVILTVSFAASLIREWSKPNEKVPAGNHQEAMLLSMPAGVESESEHVPVPPGMHVSMHGKDFRYNCQYAGGHKESLGKGETGRCLDGDLEFVWATNTRAKDSNVVTYSYEKKGA